MYVILYKLEQFEIKYVQNSIVTVCIHMSCKGVNCAGTIINTCELVEYFNLRIYIYTNDVVEAHCYFVDIGRTDCEQIRSRINNNDCRTFWPQGPL